MAELKGYKEKHDRQLSSEPQATISITSVADQLTTLPSNKFSLEVFFNQSHLNASMLYFTTILALAAAVMASPTGTPPPSDTPTCPGTGGGGSGTPTPIDVCPDGLYSNPQCCATDVLGAVGLNCAVRKCLRVRNIRLCLLTSF